MHPSVGPSAGTSGDRTAASRSRWWRDPARGRDLVVMTLAGLGVFSVFLGQGDPAEAGAWIWLRAALTLLLAVGLWWRRRHPVPVALVACLVAAVGGSWLPLWFALITVAVRHRDRRLVLVVGAALLALTVNSVGEVRTDPAEFGTLDVVAIALLVVGLIAFPVAVGAFLGARRDLVQSLHERAGRAETEQRMRAEQALLAERTRIAREMHDVLAHRISLVALHAGGLEVNPGAGPQDVEQSAALIRTTARQALEELRTVLGVLRADVASGPGNTAGADLLPQPTLDDVDQLVRASAEAGVAVRLYTDLPAGHVPPALVGRTAHRVVQEALTNVHKHATGATATVLLSGEPGASLQVQVHNTATGAGASAPLVPGSGLGLMGLRERVELAGGRLQTGPQPDGFLVHADLPWPDTEGDAAA